MRGGGIDGAGSLSGATCSQASQWGLWMSPGKACGSGERLVARLPRLGVDWHGATQHRCQTQYERTHRQRRPNSSSSSKRRCETMAFPPHTVVKWGYLPCFLGDCIIRKIQVHDPSSPRSTSYGEDAGAGGGSGASLACAVRARESVWEVCLPHGSGLAASRPAASTCGVKERRDSSPQEGTLLACMWSEDHALQRVDVFCSV